MINNFERLQIFRQSFTVNDKESKGYFWWTSEL